MSHITCSCGKKISVNKNKLARELFDNGTIDMSKLECLRIADAIIAKLPEIMEEVE